MSKDFFVHTVKYTDLLNQNIVFIVQNV